MVGRDLGVERVKAGLMGAEAALMPPRPLQGHIEQLSHQVPQAGVACTHILCVSV